MPLLEERIIGTGQAQTKDPPHQGHVFSEFSNCEIDNLGRLLFYRELPLISLAVCKFSSSVLSPEMKMSE